MEQLDKYYVLQHKRTKMWLENYFTETHYTKYRFDATPWRGQKLLEAIAADFNREDPETFKNTFDVFEVIVQAVPVDVQEKLNTASSEKRWFDRVNDRELDEKEYVHSS